MDYSTTTVVGLDVSKDWLAAGALFPHAQQVTELAKLPNDIKNLSRYVKRLGSTWPLVFVYEAGPCGFDLFRQITAMGHRCVVIAPSLMPKKPGDRVKTDRRDAEKLARYYRSGDLTEIRVPTTHEEAARDLVRAREAAVADRLAAAHRVQKYLLRFGRLYQGGRNWSRGHREWLGAQRFEEHSAELAFKAHVRALEEAEARLGGLSQHVLDLAQQEAYATGVKHLRALKGIDTLSAITLLTEVMDFRRFSKAREIMGYTGMVPSEHTTNFTPRRGRITKTGNAHIRRILVEAAWQYQRKGALSRCLSERRRDCPSEVLEIAKKADDRLHRRFWRLSQKGVLRTKVAVAVARELSGFVWAIGVKTAELVAA